MKLIYIAGPYMGTRTHDHHAYFAIHANIAKAHEASLTLARLGYGFFAPHVHSAHNEVIAPDIPASYWYALDLHFLPICAAMFVLPGESAGVRKEIAAAQALGLPVYTSLEALLLGTPPN